MPQCIECRAPVASIVNQETQTLDKCPKCGKYIDTYYEFDHVQRWIDIVLLKRRAWTHIIYNTPGMLRPLLLTAFLCCLVESFVGRSFSVYKYAAQTSAAIPEGSEMQAPLWLANGTYFQIARISQSPVFPLMRYVDTLPRLFFYACAECLLLVTVAMWTGNQKRSKVARSEDIAREWATAMGMAHAAKLGYCLFLIWKLPSSLLPVVDFLFLLWLLRGFSIVSCDRLWLHGVLGVALCATARVAFRYLTRWNPQVMLWDGIPRPPVSLRI